MSCPSWRELDVLLYNGHNGRLSLMLQKHMAYWKIIQFLALSQRKNISLEPKL